MITNILLVFNKTCSFMQIQFDRRSTTQKSPVSPKALNSWIIHTSCVTQHPWSFVCTVCIYCYNVENKIHASADAWKRMYNIHGSKNMASSVYSRLFMGCTSSLFAGLQVRWYYIVDFIVDFQWVFFGNQCRAGNFKNRRSGVSFCLSNCNKIIKRKTWPQQ